MSGQLRFRILIACPLGLILGRLMKVYVHDWPLSEQVCVLLAGSFLAWLLTLTIDRAPGSEPAQNLSAFSWFLRGETRHNVEAAAADLRKDVREMRKAKCGRWHILAVRFWITTTTIVPIIWDGLVRIAKQLPAVGAWIRATSAFLRKLDPPRLG